MVWIAADKLLLTIQQMWSENIAHVHKMTTTLHSDGTLDVSEIRITVDVGLV